MGSYGDLQGTLQGKEERARKCGHTMQCWQSTTELCWALVHRRATLALYLANRLPSGAAVRVPSTDKLRPDSHYTICCRMPMTTSGLQSAHPHPLLHLSSPKSCHDARPARRHTTQPARCAQRLSDRPTQVGRRSDPAPCIGYAHLRSTIYIWTLMPSPGEFPFIEDEWKCRPIPMRPVLCLHIELRLCRGACTKAS